MTGNYIQLTIYAAKDIGAVIYETVYQEDLGGPEQMLVFGGNLEEFTKYMNSRAAALLDEKKDAEQPRLIEPPVKVRLRRPKSEQAPVADPLDALERLEGEAD